MKYTVFGAAFIGFGLLQSEAMAMDIYVPSSSDPHVREVYDEISDWLKKTLPSSHSIVRDENCFPTCIGFNNSDVRLEYKVEQSGEIFKAELSVLDNSGTAIQVIHFYGQTDKQLVYKAVNHSKSLLRTISQEVKPSPKASLFKKKEENTNTLSELHQKIFEKSQKKHSVKAKKESTKQKTNKKIRIGIQHNISNIFDTISVSQGRFISSLPGEEESQSEDFDAQSYTQASYEYVSVDQNGESMSSSLQLGYWAHPKILLEGTFGALYGEAKAVTLNRNLHLDPETVEKDTSSASFGTLFWSAGVQYNQHIWKPITILAGASFTSFMFPDITQDNILGFPFDGVNLDAVQVASAIVAPEFNIWKALSLQFRYSFSYVLSTPAKSTFSSEENYEDLRDSIGIQSGAPVTAS